MTRHCLIVLSILTFAACGDDDAGENRDVVTTTDATVATDTSVTSDTTTDTLVPEDTGMSDTGMADTGTVDTGAADTGTVDTGTDDTGVADTGTDDTGVADAEPEDVAEDVVVGPEHLEVFFASVMSFDTNLAAAQFDGGFATTISGEGEQGKLVVQFSGTTTGTYTCGPSITNVIWTRTSGASENTDAALGGSCTIVITKYQAGGRIEGTFSGVMAALPPDIGIPFNEGKFSVFIQ